MRVGASTYAVGLRYVVGGVETARSPAWLVGASASSSTVVVDSEAGRLKIVVYTGDYRTWWSRFLRYVGGVGSGRGLSCLAVQDHRVHPWRRCLAVCSAPLAALAVCAAEAPSYQRELHLQRTAVEGPGGRVTCAALAEETEPLFAFVLTHHRWGTRCWGGVCDRHHHHRHGGFKPGLRTS